MGAEKAKQEKEMTMQKLVLEERKEMNRERRERNDSHKPTLTGKERQQENTNREKRRKIPERSSTSCRRR